MRPKDKIYVEMVLAELDEVVLVVKKMAGTVPGGPSGRPCYSLDVFRQPTLPNFSVG